ncbi:Metabotropic glutamate receptor B, partial [Operophtera brumata]
MAVTISLSASVTLVCLFSPKVSDLPKSPCADKETQTNPADFKLGNGQTITPLDKLNLKPEGKKIHDNKTEDRRLHDNKKGYDTTQCNNQTYNHQK